MIIPPAGIGSCSSAGISEAAGKMEWPEILSNIAVDP
jgi:hypothetical protein